MKLVITLIISFLSFQTFAVDSDSISKSKPKYPDSIQSDCYLLVVFDDHVKPEREKKWMSRRYKGLCAAVSRDMYYFDDRYASDLYRYKLSFGSTLMGITSRPSSNGSQTTSFKYHTNFKFVDRKTGEVLRWEKTHTGSVWDDVGRYLRGLNWRRTRDEAVNQDSIIELEKKIANSWLDNDSVYINVEVLIRRHTVTNYTNCKIYGVYSIDGIQTEALADSINYFALKKWRANYTYPKRISNNKEQHWVCIRMKVPIPEELKSEIELQ